MSDPVIKKRELPKELPMGFRSVKIRAVADGDKRTYPVVLSSDTPVKRSGWFGWFYEVLPHERAFINTERLENGLATLVNHDPNQRAGVIENYALGGGKLRGNVRFNTTDFGKSVRQEVDDETLSGGSIGYTVDNYKRIADVNPDDDSDEDYLGTFSAERWTPYEYSLTPIEADVTSGVGRNTDVKFPVRFTSVPAAVPEIVLNPASQETRMSEVAVLNNDALKAERTRCAAISLLQRNYPDLATRELADKWINEGTSELECRSVILDAQREKQAKVNAGGVVHLSEKEARTYDFMKLIRNQAYKGDGNRQEAGFELEISQQISKTLGRDSGGVFVPTDQPIFKLSREERDKRMSTRALEAGSFGAGGATVAVDLIGFLDVLRPACQLFKMGAKFMGGMSSNFSLPKMLTDTGFNWAAENPGVDNTDTDPTFGQVSFTPNGAIASTSWSRQLIVQSSIDVEARVRNSIVQLAAIGIEKAALQGSGGTQPTGLLSTTGVNLEVLGTNGAVPAYNNFVDMNTKIAVANAEIGAEAYLLTPEIIGQMAITPELSNTIALPVYRRGKDGKGEIYGYDCYKSNLLPKTLTKGTSGAVCHAGLYGVWSEFTIAEFGAMEIILDPYTLARQALIRTTANFLVDSNATYAQAFTAYVDALV